MTDGHPEQNETESLAEEYLASVKWLNQETERLLQDETEAFVARYLASKERVQSVRLRSELEAAYERLFRLRASHDRLLAAGKGMLLHGLPGLGQSWDHVAFEALRAAIAAAEELTQ